VVVVSINHRLNILGYFDVSSLGEKYWNSVNVGNADMVARWSDCGEHRSVWRRSGNVTCSDSPAAA
jgi:hypothetical protein